MDQDSNNYVKPIGKLAKDKEGCFTCGSLDHWSKNCLKNGKNKDTGSELEERNGGSDEVAEGNDDLVERPEVLAKQLEQDDAKSILIDGDEYITVNVYNNDYYNCNSNSEYMVAMMEAPEEGIDSGRLSHTHVTCDFKKGSNEI
ncbi:hypothetical protein C0995_015787 [Termitomyces sp. Mi166|nr:hypothetical protein C0995_015787 [Termitomyces sp. Mi166\